MSASSLEMRYRAVMERSLATRQETQQIREHSQSLRQSSEALRADTKAWRIESHHQASRAIAICDAAARLKAEYEDTAAAVRSLVATQHDIEESSCRHTVDDVVKLLIQSLNAKGTLAFRWDATSDIPVFAMPLIGHRVQSRFQ